MKLPKEPKAWKYPRMYARFWSDSSLCRLRIVNPDGTAVWFDDFSGTKKGPPCYCLDTLKNLITKSGADVVRRMKAYDRKWGFKTTYIGEIK